MVTIVAMGEREVLSIEVMVSGCTLGNVERISTPEPENPYWEIELKDKAVIMATRSVTVQYKAAS